MALERIVYAVGAVLKTSVGEGTIIKVHPFGTVDVRFADGQTARVSGLPVFRVDKQKKARKR